MSLFVGEIVFIILHYDITYMAVTTSHNEK